MTAALALNFLLSLAAVGAVALLARWWGMLDRPGPRASHRQPTPTGGGIGLVLSLLVTAVVVGADPMIPRIGSAAFSPYWPLVFLPLAMVLSVVGFLDDLRGVSPWVRLGLQSGVAAALILTLGAGAGPAWSIALLLLALVWTMNAVNFMDGSNGLAGAQGLFSAALLAGLFHWAGAGELALAAACLAAACAGFLPWNTPRARVFMGDAGSVPLGFLLGGLALAGALEGILAWPVAALVLVVFYVDAGLTLLSRMARGERWYTPHRRHVYQRLIAQGWSHAQVMLLYSAVNVAIVTPGVMLGTIHSEWAWWVAAALVGLLCVAWCAVSLKLGEEP